MKGNVNAQYLVSCTFNVRSIHIWYFSSENFLSGKFNSLQSSVNLLQRTWLGKLKALSASFYPSVSQRFSWNKISFFVKADGKAYITKKTKRVSPVSKYFQDV